jgi:signal transduction histidine kinase
MRWAGAATSVQLQQQRSWQIPPPCCVAAGTRGTQRLQWRLGAASLLVQPLPLPRMAYGPCRVAATGEGSTPPGTWQRRDDTSVSNSPASHHHHHQQQQQQQQQQPAPSPLRGAGPSAAAVETLRTVLPVSAGEARLLLLHRPELGLLPRQRLADGWQALQRALPLPAPMLLRAAHQQPQLLEAPSAVLAQRLADAASTLRLPRNALRSKAPRRTPMLHCTLLLLPRSQLEARVGCLSDALGCSARQADLARLLCDEPRLLEVGQAQLLSTVQALEQV